MLRGNYIGTNASGSAALGNRADGLFISGDSNLVGGLLPVEANVISGNNANNLPLRGGVSIGGSEADGNVLQGNIVGANASGTGPIPNLGFGIRLESATDNNTIGGNTPASGNQIAFNTGAGIVVGAAGFAFVVQNRILSNSIAGNGGPGIDIGNDGLTPNDAGDTDTGPNQVQNFPSGLSARPDAGGTHVEGLLESSANGSFTVQLFSNASCDPNGYGEGEVFLGSTEVKTDGAGQVTFSASFPSIPPGHRVTATATDVLGNTSEFSACSPVATRFFTVTPCRVADTRLAFGPSGGPALQAHAQRNFPVAGTCQIPATARSVAFNFTVVVAGDSGYLTVYPTGAPLPLASTINYGIGKTRANNAIVSLGSAGEVSVLCSQPTGQTHLVIDVVGYFD